jgi:hypothetical protein
MNDERDGLYIHQNQDKPHTNNIKQIKSVVSLSYTHAEPRAVMIYLFYTGITVMTVR